MTLIIKSTFIISHCDKQKLVSGTSNELTPKLTNK